MRVQKPYRFNKIYTFDQIFENSQDDLKFGYFNINGFLQSNHAEYLDADFNLLHLDFLVIAETWLNKETSDSNLAKRLNNWTVLKRLDATDDRKHMGLLLLTPASNKNVSEVIYNLDYIEGFSSGKKDLLYQGLVIDIKKLYKRTVFLYIRETPNNSEIQKLKTNLKNCDCVIGDLNLNPKIPEQKGRLKTLCGKTRYMALREITSTNGAQLDHVIVEKDLESTVFATAYFNFTSDHYSIVMRISSLSNSFTSEFKQSQTFDHDYHLKKRKPRSEPMAYVGQDSEKTSQLKANNKEKGAIHA